VSSISLDWQVVTFAFGLVVVTAFLCGIIPALAAAHTSVNETLKEGGRTGSPAAATRACVPSWWSPNSP
jgi:hypothetical protein